MTDDFDLRRIKQAYEEFRSGRSEIQRPTNAVMPAWAQLATECSTTFIEASRPPFRFRSLRRPEIHPKGLHRGSSFEQAGAAGDVNHSFRRPPSRGSSTGNATWRLSTTPYLEVAEVI
jgi:hypothetical protein